MMDAEIAWRDLGEALENQTACERYEASRKWKGKSRKETIESLEKLKEKLERGIVYGNTRNVCPVI